MLDEPPRLKPPPPRPPPPPPPPRPPPRASTSWMLNATKLTKAVSIAMPWTRLRMLLSRSLIGCQLDLLRIRVRHECEIGVGKGRIDHPRQPGVERRLGRIIAVDDHQLARKRLISLLDPDLPIHVVFAEGVMVRFSAIDRGRADVVSGLQRLDPVFGSIAPAEQVLEWQGYAELVVDGVQNLLGGRRSGDG